MANQTRLDGLNVDRPFTVKPRPRPLYFLFACIGVLSFLGWFEPNFSSLADRLETDNFEEIRISLTSSVLAMAEGFNRQRWMFYQAQPLLRRFARHEFSQVLIDRLARSLGKLFPGAQVFGFSPKGRLAYQTGNEPRKTREMIWRGIIANIRQETSGDEAEKLFEAPARICRSLFGTATTLSDLSGADNLPQMFLNRNRSFFSWAIPQEILTGTPSTELGGIWIIADPETLPAVQIGLSALRLMNPLSNLACVVVATGSSGKIESRRGPGLLPRAILRKTLANQTEFQTPSGLWCSRSIPGESNRYVIAGFSSETTKGWVGRNRGAIRGGVIALLLLGLGLAWRSWWTGQPLPWTLKQQVVILFALTAVLPLAILIGFGRERAREVGRLERAHWEERILTTLNGIDVSFEEFKNAQEARIQEIEAVISRRLSAATDPMSLAREACRKIDKVELLIIQTTGRPTRLNKMVSSPQREKDEFRKLLCQFLAHILDTQNIPVPKSISDKKTLIQGKERERFFDTLYRSYGEFNLMELGKRRMMNRIRILKDGNDDTIALLSWIFDEAEFGREFVEQISREAQAGKFGQVRIALIGDDGRVLPPSLRRSMDLLNLANRVATFKSSEVAEITVHGKPVLAAGLPPLKLWGYQLLGMIDASLLTREKSTLSSFLLIMVAWSVIWMIACALFLSRRLVGQVTNLREFIDQISMGRFQARAVVASQDELGRLTQTFNTMAEKLEQLQRLRRFVSDQEWIESKKEDLDLVGLKVEAAVLFSHIHQFDAILEREPPDRLIGMLNAYFSRMEPVIRSEHGQIDKLIGDAIMAVFVKEPGTDHPALRAVRSAVSMLTLPGSAEASPVSPRPAIRTDIGIHFGLVISGNIGSREGRLNNTVIGDTVNTSARLCSAAGARPRASLLVSETVSTHLAECFSLVRLDPVRLKGKREPIGLFEVSISSEQPAVASDFSGKRPAS